jgi:hypothetical protein
MKASEFEHRVSKAVNDVVKALDKLNKEHNSEPIILDRCPHCSKDIGDYILKRDLSHEFAKLLSRHNIIEPD